MALANIAEPKGYPTVATDRARESLGEEIINFSMLLREVEEALHIPDSDIKEPVPERDKVTAMIDGMKTLNLRLCRVKEVVSNL